MGFFMLLRATRSLVNGNHGKFDIHDIVVDLMGRLSNARDVSIWRCNAPNAYLRALGQYRWAVPEIEHEQTIRNERRSCRAEDPGKRIVGCLIADDVKQRNRGIKGFT